MRIRSNDVELDVRVQGEGDPVLLLHGWPEAKELWRQQIPPLTAHGFRVIAPDLRGFGESDRPEGVEQYNMVASVLDVVAILDQLECERVALVGHDFGAALAWSVAAFLPDRVTRLVAMSVGHPRALFAADLEQRQKMWYALLFQFPGVAEDWLRADDWRNLRLFLADHPELDRCIANLARPGALTSTLNWYRSNLTPEMFGAAAPDFPPIKAPTLAIWSDRDHALTERVMLESEQYVDGPWEYVRLEGVGHFIPLAAPDRLNRLLLDFLR